MVGRKGVFPAVFLFLAAALLLTGCNPHKTVIREAQYDIGSRSMVVIPFRDEMHTYFESRDGVDLAMAVVGEMRKRGAATNMKPSHLVRAMFPGKDLEQVGWDAVGKKVGAGLILTGSIRTFTLKDPGHIMLRRGTCELDFFIYDVETGTIACVFPSLAVFYPERGGPIAASDIEEATLRRKLIAIAAHEVVKKFYAYEEKISPPPRRY